MELFDLLETRVVELLGQIDTLREENKTLQEKVNALDEENKTLKESLEQEQHTKEEINGRIDTLLSTIREFTGVTDRYPYAQLSAQCPRHGHFLPYGC